MFARIPFAALLAAVVVRAQQCTVLDPIEYNLANIALGARVLSGDATCSSDGTNVRAFVAVTLSEAAAIAGSDTVTTPATLTSDCTEQTTSVVATATATATVCLCVQAGVTLDGNTLPASVNAAALADLRPAVEAQAGLSTGLGALSNILDNYSPSISLMLEPIDQTTCTCPVTSQPTCANGQCGCIPCPAGETYNAGTGECSLAPSAAAGRNRRRSTLEVLDLQARQAKRMDIVKKIRE